MQNVAVLSLNVEACLSLVGGNAIDSVNHMLWDRKWCYLDTSNNLVGCDIVHFVTRFDWSKV